MWNQGFHRVEASPLMEKAWGGPVLLLCDAIRRQSVFNSSCIYTRCAWYHIPGTWYLVHIYITRIIWDVIINRVAQNTRCCCGNDVYQVYCWLVVCMPGTRCRKKSDVVSKYFTIKLKMYPFFRTPVPFWGQISLNLNGLSPSRGCGTKGVNTYQ